MARATWADFSSFLSQAQGGSLGPTAGFVVSNGLVGLGVNGVYPADSEGSAHDTLFLAGQFTSAGVRSIKAFPNPISAIIVDHGAGDGIDEGDIDEGKTLLEFDTRTGVYSATFPFGRFKAKWELVVPPGTSSFVERLSVSGPAGGRLPIDTEFADAVPATFKKVISQKGFTERWTLGPEGRAKLEVWHGFDVSARPESFEEAASRTEVWASGVSSPRITIDGPAEDQLFVNSALYNLRSGVNPDGPTGPFGLTNSKYGGRAFWDADVWMFPALALLDPARAASIPNFRLETREAATKHAYRWAVESREQFHPQVDPYKYPWEAGPDGAENAPSESRKQEHITADVALMMRTASALGIVDSAEAKKTIKGCAQYLWHRATRLPTGEWGVLDTMSPDEFHTGNNDLYTNVAFEQVLKAGFPDRWKDWRFKRPHDGKTFLTYDEDMLRGYKQAAALLAIWPLQDPACEKEADRMLERFEEKSTRSGPAMSASVEALIMARTGDPERAYQHWKRSWTTYTKRPLLMFSEAPNGKNAYFLTGAAGCLNALLYGMVGLRLDDHDPGEKPWKLALKDGFWLSCQPNLPKAWKSVTIDNLSVLGKKYRLSAKGRTVVVTAK